MLLSWRKVSKIIDKERRSTGRYDKSDESVFKMAGEQVRDFAHDGKRMNGTGEAICLRTGKGDGVLYRRGRNYDEGQGENPGKNNDRNESPLVAKRVFLVL